MASRALMTRFRIAALNCGGSSKQTGTTGARSNMTRTSGPAPYFRNDARWIMKSLARSEEQTSELQSLMRISYAVFRLKKKIPELTEEEQETKRTQIATPVH